MMKILLYFLLTILPMTDSKAQLGQNTDIDMPYDVREATIATLHQAYLSNLTTVTQVVSSFISRIETYNPSINAIITLNPAALTDASALDAQLSANNNCNIISASTIGPLFGIPILLKDNYNAVPMPTTAGCLALRNLTPTSDAPTVAALHKAGVIILGKTNLHELALEGLSVSSYGGQTRNPYDLTRTPGGSSGGTGAAIAASFAVLGTGTDTVNSLRSPASANSLFSVRPTRGLITRSGVVPISYTQDAVGVIGRCVEDIAVALTVIASVGYDPKDNITARVPPEVRSKDYAAVLDGPELTTMRFGMLEGFFNRTASDETTPVNNAMDNIVRVLTEAGATMVPITESIYNATAILAQLDVQTSEYREGLTSYLQNPNLTGSHPASMPDLYENTTDFLVIPSQYSYVNSALNSSTSDATYLRKLHGITNLTTALQKTFVSNNLDFIIHPEQKNLVVKVGSPSQSGRNGILAALTGSPVVTIPIGFSPATNEAPIGVPIGMEILGRPWSEGDLLNVAKKIDDLTHVRRAPVLTSGVVTTKEYEGLVPRVVPDSSSVPSEYPIGQL